MFFAILRLSTLIKRLRNEINNLVVEIADDVYKKSSINGCLNKNTEPIITALKFEIETIITNVLETLANVTYTEYDD